MRGRAGQDRSRGMRTHGATAKPRKRGARPTADKSWIWGAHAVEAVLANPRRTVHELIVSEGAARKMRGALPACPTRTLPPREMDGLLPPGAVHQGLAVRAAPLEWPALEDLAASGDLVLVLDQITDPHNVGAMLRLASAFGVDTVVMQDRHAPPLTGATAKVAVGCVESVPVSKVTNIARSLEALQACGYQVVGLAGDTETGLADAVAGLDQCALVMGAEGPGLRDRVAKTCDRLARIPMVSDGQPGTAESLNVATAAAIALYEARNSLG